MINLLVSRKYKAWSVVTRVNYCILLLLKVANQVQVIYIIYVLFKAGEN